MNNNEFMINLIAKLNKQLSKRSINNDLKTLDNTMYVKVIAKLSKALSKRELKKELKELNDLYIQVGADLKIDKELKTKLQGKIKALQDSLSDIEIGLKMSDSSAKIKNGLFLARQKAQNFANINPISFNLQVKKDKLVNDITYLGKRYSKLFSNVAATQKYENLLNSAHSISSRGQLSDVRAQLAAFTSELKVNGLAAQSTTDKWGKLIERSKELFSATAIITTIFTQVKRSVSTMLKLDTALTDLYKVQSDISSREQFSGVLKKWNKLAQDLSVTTESLINSTAEWSKIGFNMDMSKQLAQLTAIFEKTAEITNKQASETLISAAQAFTEVDSYGIEDYTERVEAVGDKINKIGNEYAISSEGIAEALQNSSASLKMANNNIDESIAMIATANKIFQSPGEVGNMLKVVSARVRGQKGELEELGEDVEGIIEGVSKVQTQILNLTGNKVNIFESDNETLKSTYDILLEVGKVLNTLSDKDSASLLEILFGKQRMSSGASLLLNYEELEKVKNDSMNAAGSMAEEYKKYLESAEAHIITFKEKLTETYSTFISGDLIKYTSDIGSAVLDLVNSTDLLQHSLLAIITLNVGKAISTIGAGIVNTSRQMNLLGNAMQKIKQLPLDDVLRTSALSKIGNATKNLTEKNLKLLLSQVKLEEADMIAILQRHNLTAEEAKAKLQKMGLITATNAQTKANIKETASTFTLKGAMASLRTTIKGVGLSLKTAFLSNPVGWILMGITTAISVVSSAISSHNQKLEEARQKAVELTQAYKQEQNTLDSQISKYKELKESLDSGTLSTDEARTTKEQLLEIQKSLIDSFGSEASNLDLVNGKYAQQLALLNNLTKSKAKEHVMTNMDSYKKSKEALEKEKPYFISSLNLGNRLAPTSKEKQELIDFIKSYSDSIALAYMELDNIKHASITMKADAFHAPDILAQFYKDLETYGEEHKVDVTPILEDISKQIKEFKTDDVLKENKEIYDAYIEAQVLGNDRLRALYADSIQAVEEYNNALSSGEGVEDAKKNLERLQQSVKVAAGEVEGSQTVFDGIFDAINKNTEAAYLMSKAFENDENVKNYAEQLKGLQDIDLKAINFEDNIQSPGEKAFGALIDILGLTEDQVQSLIDKLVELGYVTGNSVKVEPPSFSSIITSNKSSIDDYQSKLKTIQDSLANLSDTVGDTSAELDLLQKILEMEPDFDVEMYKNADGTIRFEEALKALLLRLKNKAINDLPKELEGYLSDMADSVFSAATAFESLSDAMSTIDGNYTLLTDVNSEIERTGTLSYDTLQKIIGKYQELEPIVMDYLNKRASEQDILNALTKAYDNDLSNYKQYYAAKHAYDVDFYKKVVSNISDDVKEKAKSYGIDLENYKNLATAKAQIDQNLIKHSDKNYQKRMKTLGLKEIQAALTEGVNLSVQDYTPTYQSSSSSGSSSSSKYSEEIDFAKYKLEELEKEIDKFRAKVDNASQTGMKNHTIDQIIAVEQKKKEVLLGILDLYQKEASGLLESIPAKYRDMARDGSIAIESFVGTSNEKVVSAIKEYRTMAGSVADVTSQLHELNSEVQSLKLEKFNNLKSEYDNQFGILSSFIDQFKAQIDLLDSQGYAVSEKLYQQMMEKTNWQIEMLKNEREALVKQMSDIIKSTPNLSKENFYEMTNAIADIDSQINSCVSSLEEFNNAIRDIPWNNFDRVMDSLSSVNNELSGLENLLGSYDLTTDEGEFSDYGLAQLGILAQQYELARYQTQQYTEAIEELDKEYDAGKWTALEYSEKLQELVSAQWGSVNATTSAKDAILELAKSRVDSEISSIDKAIDTYEELIKAQIKELQAEKDLHDFRKSINDQQSTIASLEKQLAAITNDTSNAAKAKRAQLEEQLKNAREELDELYYDQSIKEKEDALNEELERYKKLQEDKKKELEESLQDENKLIGDYIDLANANASTIADILEELAKEHGIKISDCIIDPWKSGQDAVSNYKGSLKNAASSFKTSLDGIKGSILSLTTSADSLAQSFIDMFNVNTSAFLKDLTNIAEILNLINGVADKTTQTAGEWRYDKDKINSQNGKGSWWYEHEDGGYTKNGWEQIDGKWYFFDSDGWMKTGWYQDKDGNWYYLSDGSIGKEGEMLTDTTTPDGYYVDTSGKWSQSAGTNNNTSDSGNSSSSSSNQTSSYGNVSEVSGTLRFGGANSSGNKALQHALSQLGYDLEVDGKFGTKTLSAVKAFQQKSGISEDGIVGADTKRAFAKAGFSKGGVISDIIHANDDDGIATVQRGETILPQCFTQILPKAVETMDNFIGNNFAKPFVPSNINNNSNYNIENKVIVQGSVSTENLSVLTKAMEKVAEKTVNNTMQKICDRRVFKGRTFL